MRLKGYRPLTCWLNMLGLPRQTPRAWHCDRLREEIRELQKANNGLEKLSEASDVLFSISRARHDGYNIRPLPSFFDRKYMLVYMYMIGKFSSWWMFFRTAALLCRAPHLMREVVNPAKDKKLRQVAVRHEIDPIRFEQVCQRLLHIWPLFP